VLWKSTDISSESDWINWFICSSRFFCLSLCFEGRNRCWVWFKGVTNLGWGAVNSVFSYYSYHRISHYSHSLSKGSTNCGRSRMSFELQAFFTGNEKMCKVFGSLYKRIQKFPDWVYNEIYTYTINTRWEVTQRLWRQNSLLWLTK